MNSPPQQLDGIFQFPEQDIAVNTAIIIDATYLQERPFLANESWYADLGRKTTSLTLSGIDETDAEFILPLFTALRHLSLEKITILNKDFRGLPNKGIVSLQLVDSKITTKLARPWFHSLGKSLLSVKISRCSHAVQGSFFHMLTYLPDSVRSLSVYDPICTSISIVSLPACLTYLHLETPMRSDYFLIDTIPKCAPQITTLILKMSEIDLRSIEQLKKLTNLQHLRILNSVDCIGQSLLQSLGLQTLDVHCYEPPEKDDQILKLNDDCLLHVFSFLRQEEWMALSQANSRFDGLVTTYIYPREEIIINEGGINEDFSEQEKTEILKSLQKYATTIKVRNFQGSHFELKLSDNLRTLTLNGYFPAACIQTIPSGIKKLRLDLYIPANLREDSVEKVPQLSDLFHRLGPTLTSLTLEGRFNPDDLFELTNLRELKVKDWKGTDLIGILQRNEDHLERLQVDFGSRSSQVAWNDFPFPLCPLKRLKVLRLIYINCRIDLKPSDFPSLEELKVFFYVSLDKSTKADLLRSISKFVQLKSLSVGNMDFAELFQLKNLEYLECRGMQSRDILEMVKQLPKLTKLKWGIDLDFETEIRLRQFLITEMRTLRFDGVVLP